MAEYSREQRNQLSRVIANSESGSKQLKGVVDNRTHFLLRLNSGINSMPSHLISPSYTIQRITFIQYDQFLRRWKDSSILPITGCGINGNLAYYNISLAGTQYQIHMHIAEHKIVAANVRFLGEGSGHTFYENGYAPPSAMKVYQDCINHWSPI